MENIILLAGLAGAIYIWYSCYYLNIKEIDRKHQERMKEIDAFSAETSKYNKKYNSREYEKYKGCESYNSLVNAYEKYKVTSLQYGSQALGAQMYQKKSDSAILGGAASAVGGTLYGAATYINNEIKNSQIDEHNKNVASYNAKTRVMKEDVIKCMRRIDELESRANSELLKKKSNV